MNLNKFLDILLLPIRWYDARVTMPLANLWSKALWWTSNTFVRFICHMLMCAIVWTIIRLISIVVFHDNEISGLLSFIVVMTLVGIIVHADKPNK